MAFGISFFLFGFSLLFHFYGFILCGMSVFFFSKDGSEIDLDSKTYRTFFSLFGYRFGKWKTLPDVEYVSVFKTAEINTVRSLGAEANVKSDVIQLNLFYNRNQKITAYTTKYEADAFKIAREIAQILNIDILDATKSESKWL